MRRVVCVEFFIFGESLLGRIQGDREPVSFMYIFEHSFILHLLHPSVLTSFCHIVLFFYVGINLMVFDVMGPGHSDLILDFSLLNVIC